MRTTTWTTWMTAALVGVLALGGCAPATTGRPARTATGPVGAAAESPLVGSWHLLWLELPGPDGALRRITDAKGSLIYTPSGQVSVQVMYARTGDTPSSGPVQYAQGGFEGSFGQYVVDEATRMVTHRYDGANVRALLGQDVPRRYELTGRRLVLRSTRGDEHWSVTWERY
jgi:Lipocalin-like domain